jgi:O-acetyl-ADP-ribose deacetylase (regulator of RNase III)
MCAISANQSGSLTAAKQTRYLNSITLHYGDITKQSDVDVIATSIPVNLDVSSPINAAIIKAAGADLDNFILENIYKPRVGDVHPVPPFDLPYKYIFCAIMPLWDTSLGFEDRDLTRCYRNSIELATRLNIERIAMPAMGAHARAQPLPRLARLALSGIMDRMTDDIKEVRIVCDDDNQITAFYDRLQKLGWRGRVIYDDMP